MIHNLDNADGGKGLSSVFWSQDTIGGRRLGMPAERSARFLLYNVSWARELGFNTPPSNADDLQLQACHAHQAMLTDTDRSNDGQGGWLVDTNSTTSSHGSWPLVAVFWRETIIAF